MSEDEYTPTTKDVPNAAFLGLSVAIAADESDDHTPEDIDAVLNRWLAAERARWQAEAWDQGFDVGNRGQHDPNPYESEGTP